MNYKMHISAAIAAAMITFSGAAHAADQASADVGASADVITPLTVTKNQDLAFGKFVVNGATAGTVVIAAAGTRSKTGGVDLVASTGVQNGQVTVVGQTGVAYTVSLPASVNLTDASSNTMALGTFTTDQADLTALSGTKAIKIGGTLAVGATQAPGAYSGTITVAANYN